MPDFSTIDNSCLDSWHILISGQFKHRYPLNISCSKIFDSFKIKRNVNNLTQLGYVNNYDKNRYLEKFSKAAVFLYVTCATNLHNTYCQASMCTHFLLSASIKRALVFTVSY